MSTVAAVHHATTEFFGILVCAGKSTTTRHFCHVSTNLITAVLYRTDARATLGRNRGNHAPSGSVRSLLSIRRRVESSASTVWGREPAIGARERAPTMSSQPWCTRDSPGASDAHTAPLHNLLSAPEASAAAGGRSTPACCSDSE